MGKDTNTATKVWRICTAPFIFLTVIVIVVALHTVFPIAWILELAALGTFIIYCVSYPFKKMGAKVDCPDFIFNGLDDDFLNALTSIFIIVLLPFIFTVQYLKTGEYEGLM